MVSILLILSISPLSSCTGVVVSIMSMISIGEGDEMVQICAILMMVVEDTEKDITITLATSDGTGKSWNKLK